MKDVLEGSAAEGARRQDESAAVCFKLWGAREREWEEAVASY